MIPPTGTPGTEVKFDPSPKYGIRTQGKKSYLIDIVSQDRKCATSNIQRKLAIGYNKAARLVEQMEDQGLVSPANHVGKREILIPE